MACWAKFFAVEREGTRCRANFFAEKPVEAPCWAKFFAGEADGKLCRTLFLAGKRERALCWAKFFAELLRNGRVGRSLSRGRAHWRVAAGRCYLD